MGYEKTKAIEKADARRSRKKKRAGFGDYKFVDINLTAEEKDIFREEHAAPEMSAIGMVAEWVSSGYKLSLTRDERGGGVLVTLTSRFGAEANEGYILTARASAVEKAIYVLWYKDIYICEAGSWIESANMRAGVGGDIG